MNSVVDIDENDYDDFITFEVFYTTSVQFRVPKKHDFLSIPDSQKSIYYGNLEYTKDNIEYRILGSQSEICKRPDDYHNDDFWENLDYVDDETGETIVYVPLNQRHSCSGFNSKGEKCSVIPTESYQGHHFCWRHIVEVEHIMKKLSV